MSRETLEAWYFWSQIFLAGIVLLSAILALIQLRMIKRQSHANLLLELDRRWESEDMLKARIVISQEREKIGNEVIRAVGERITDDSRELFKILSAEHLSFLRANKFHTYRSFVPVWGFVETMGLLEGSGYLTAREVDQLFGHAIIQIDDLSRLHKLERDIEESEKVGGDADLYTNSLRLADKVRNYQQVIRWVGRRSWFGSIVWWLFSR